MTCSSGVINKIVPVCLPEKKRKIVVDADEGPLSFRRPGEEREKRIEKNWIYRQCDVIAYHGEIVTLEEEELLSDTEEIGPKSCGAASDDQPARGRESYCHAEVWLADSSADFATVFSAFRGVEKSLLNLLLSRIHELAVCCPITPKPQTERGRSLEAFPDSIPCDLSSLGCLLLK